MARELRGPEDDERPPSRTLPAQSHPACSVYKLPRPCGGTAARLLEASNSCHKDARTRRGEPRSLTAGCPAKQHWNRGRSTRSCADGPTACSAVHPLALDPPQGRQPESNKRPPGFPNTQNPTEPHRASFSPTELHTAIRGNTEPRRQVAVWVVRADLVGACPLRGRQPGRLTRGEGNTEPPEPPKGACRSNNGFLTLPERSRQKAPPPRPRWHGKGARCGETACAHASCWCSGGVRFTATRAVSVTRLQWDESREADPAVAVRWVASADPLAQGGASSTATFASSVPRPRPPWKATPV